MSSAFNINIPVIHAEVGTSSHSEVTATTSLLKQDSFCYQILHHTAGAGGAGAAGAGGVAGAGAAGAAGSNAWF